MNSACSVEGPRKSSTVAASSSYLFHQPLLVEEADTVSSRLLEQPIEHSNHNSCPLRTTGAFLAHGLAICWATSFSLPPAMTDEARVCCETAFRKKRRKYDHEKSHRKRRRPPKLIRRTDQMTSQRIDKNRLFPIGLDSLQNMKQQTRTPEHCCRRGKQAHASGAHCCTGGDHWSARALAN